MLTQVVSGLFIGYLFWTLLSHPKSPIPKLCPKINLGKRVQILPRLKIFYKEHKALIFHHWLCAILILIFFLIFSDGLALFKGFLVGSIGQGLRYQDRFQLRETRES
jgi:hypothetical protein